MTLTEEKICNRATWEICDTAFAEGRTLDGEINRIGIASNTYLKWRCCYAVPKAEQLAKLATYGYDVAYILTGMRMKPQGRTRSIFLTEKDAEELRHRQLDEMKGAARW